MKPMQIRTYRARNLKEALQMVREDLGPETRVVQTREVRVGWWERFSRGRQFEIRTRLLTSQPLPLRRHSSSFDVETNPVTEQPNPTTSDARLETTVANEFVDRAKCHFAGDSSPPGLSSAKLLAIDDFQDNTVSFELLTELLDADVPESVARELLSATRSAAVQGDGNTWRHEIRERLSQCVMTTGPIRVVDRRQVIALVGPTGVGKTTTIAKLAADIRLRERRRVGLITMDTYRVAAVDQLRTYADIMDLPLEVVSTPREMRDAVTRFADEDLVLIDTAGRSPHDAVQIQQLKSLLAEAQPDQVQLVLSCVCSVSHMRQIVDKFAPVGCTSLLVTKLDEAMAIGSLVPVLQEAGLPVSYLTCGQSVPDDIVVAQKDKLIASLVGQEPISNLV